VIIQVRTTWRYVRGGPLWTLLIKILLHSTEWLRYRHFLGISYSKGSFRSTATCLLCFRICFRFQEKRAIRKCMPCLVSNLSKQLEIGERVLWSIAVQSVAFGLVFSLSLSLSLDIIYFQWYFHRYWSIAVLEGTNTTLHASKGPLHGKWLFIHSSDIFFDCGMEEKQRRVPLLFLEVPCLVLVIWKREIGLIQ